jgi:hypothetical protein
MTERIILTESENRTYFAARVPGVNPSGPARQRVACPLHRGTGKNLAIDFSRGLWYCFSNCGRGGDAIVFELALNGGGFLAARNRVFDIVGRPMGRVSRRRARRHITMKEQADARLWRRLAVLLAEESLDDLKKRFFEPAASSIDLTQPAWSVTPADLARGTALLRYLEAIAGDSLVHEYLLWRRRAPALTDALVAIGHRVERTEHRALARYLEQVEDARNA